MSNCLACPRPKERLNYCFRHYMQIRLHGKVYTRTIFDKNEIICNKKHCEIILYDRYAKEIARAKISKKDKSRVAKHKWCFSKRNYVVSRIDGKLVSLHQLILGKKKGFEIDHINKDKLDTRAENLRYVTHRQNMLNQNGYSSTGHIGVYWDKRKKKYYAQIGYHGKSVNLGLFTNLVDAVSARCEAEQRYFQMAS